MDDDNYEGSHFFTAEFGAIDESHISSGNDATINIVDNGMFIDV